MVSRSVLLVLLMLLAPCLGVENTMLYAYVDTATIIQEETAATEVWWTPDRSRLIALGLLLSLGGTLIAISVLRRRMKTQLETIQFYEEEVNLLKHEVEKSQENTSYLFTSISNEIRAPLDEIQSFASLLEETLYEEDQLNYVGTIRSRGTELRVLVNDLRDLSQIEVDKLEIQPHSFVLQECLKEAVQNVLPRAVDKELELSYSIEPEVPRGICLDSVRLKQILTNLLNNGIKFTEHGSVSIHVSNTSSPKGHDLMFAIRDTGIGITEEQLNKITDSLTQQSSQYLQSNEGMGLGLSLCRKLIGLMGGRMGVESTIGKGSTFFFVLPATEATVQEEQPPSFEPSSEASIALVDPNRITRKIAAKFFERLGHAIADFNTIESLIAHLKTSRFQVLFVDINEVETINLMESLMDLVQAADGTPIIVITENNTGENVAALKGLGVSRVICKPIQLKELEEIVASTPLTTSS